MKFLELAALAKAHPDRIEVMMCGMKKDVAGGETHAEARAIDLARVLLGDKEKWETY